MTTREFLARYLSRKFLLGLSGPVVALLVLFWPQRQEQITQTAAVLVDLIGAIAAVATPVAFIFGEARVDAARVEAEGRKTVAAVENAPPSVASAVARDTINNPR